MQNLATFVAGYAIAFSAGWKMTLVITAVLPLLIFATYMESKFMQGFANEVNSASLPPDSCALSDQHCKDHVNVYRHQTSPSAGPQSLQSLLLALVMCLQARVL